MKPATGCLDRQEELRCLPAQARTGSVPPASPASRSGSTTCVPLRGSATSATSAAAYGCTKATRRSPASGQGYRPSTLKNLIYLRPRAGDPGCRCGVCSNLGLSSFGHARLRLATSGNDRHRPSRPEFASRGQGFNPSAPPGLEASQPRSCDQMISSSVRQAALMRLTLQRLKGWVRRVCGFSMRLGRALQRRPLAAPLTSLGSTARHGSGRWWCSWRCR